jgi:flagellar protein FlaJ
MSSISGSGISPVEIFKIIGRSKEYPNLRREIKKVINQINIYGYDLVTALGNVSKRTPSQKLSELFNGISTTVNSGGDLSEFFEKRAESLLIGYRIEREKFTKIAETFMDLYISLVIATPMLLMLLLIMITLSGTNLGISSFYMNLIIISIVALINFFFLAFLQIRQPNY